MDVLRGVRTLYISTMYIVDNQTVKNMYKPKSLENDKKLFLMRFGIITPIILNKMMLSLLFQNKVLHLQRLTRCQC